MVQKFINIFSGLERAHGCTYVEKKNADGTKVKGQSFVKREPVISTLWENHLKGIEPSLGIIPINEDNKCKWGCIDVDSYAGFDHKKLLKQIQNLKLPLITFRSKSGGAHIFLFTTVPVDASLMRNRLISIGSVLGFGSSEVFPKQVELKSKDDTGNFLNLPYFNSNKTTRYAFLESGDAATLEGFFGVYERNKLTPEQLENLKIERPQSELADGPPCLETMSIEGIGEGGRDNALFHYVVYAKKKWPQNWEGKVTLFNERHMNPPLDDNSVKRIKLQHDKKEWGYKCKDEPMCSYCDKDLCRKRKYGIGGTALFPSLSDLQKINLEKPYYYVNVDGERVKLEETAFLQDQRLFQRAVMEQINKRPPRISPKEFGQYVDLLYAGIEIIDPPKGSSTLEQLLDHLEEFCTDRTGTGATKEDMERGNVWNSEGKHHFIFREFYNKFLLRRKWKEPYDITMQLLVDKCKCKIKRETIGKKRPNIMVVEEFEKQEDTYKNKQFKPKDPF
tara:strand:+ start:230 stop:1744 length:1515 start_codon:yes stop_codon:yes gene_type:complete